MPLFAVALMGWFALAGGAPLEEARAFQDCRDCPRMVALPGGAFVIGSPADEPGRYKNEGPQRQVTVPAFAASETEVAYAQYAAFAKATNRAAAGGCYTHGDGADDISDPIATASWREPGFAQTPKHPAVCVSWHDAKAYVAWLSRKTGHTYRLPTEAEWEYAARGGTTSAFFWGSSGDSDCVHMNGGDQTLTRQLPAWIEAIRKARERGEAGSRLVACEDGSAFTAPVGRYAPNPVGLRDVTGNAWEWVEDCYQPSYEQLPADGGAYTGGECRDRRTRGGSWDDYPDDLRSAVRKRLPPDMRRSDVGFRLVRTLGPE